MTLGGVDTLTNPGSFGRMEFSRTISRGADLVPDKTTHVKGKSCNVEEEERRAR